IERLTREAIIYFSKFNMNKEAKKLVGYPSLFEELATSYPAAWMALLALGELQELEHVYITSKRTVASRDMLEPLLIKNGRSLVEVKATDAEEFSTRFDNRISLELYQQLLRCDYMITDTFKTLTRNPGKLMAMM